MSWTNEHRLAKRLDSLPLVLCGPILRKVTPTSVTVWLVLKKAATVTLSVFSTDDTQNMEPLFAPKTEDTVAIGAHLHMLAITTRAEGKPPLQPGITYFYHLSFTTDSGSLTFLGAVGRSDSSVYAYEGLQLPSFQLPPDDIKQVRLMLGSCRKPNAMPPDALTILDQEIGLSIANRTTRPHQLILGGDQIYADEVADVLLLMLSDAAKALMGTPEKIDTGTTRGTIEAESEPPTTREDLITKQAGFTTVDFRSHLMSLGEYLAMYLFAWSDVLWPKPDEIPTANDLIAAGVPTDKLQDLKFLVSIDDQRTNVMAFATTLKQARRALANIPTYMILDDHEITDDFNMTREFCEKVYGSPLGMRVVRNGLAAYALCQHWGNAPEQFQSSPAMPKPPAGVEFLKVFAKAGSNPQEFDKTLQRVLGLHTPAEMAAKDPFAVFHDEGNRVPTADGWVDDTSLLFHYTIETPAYQVIVTDSRTWRSFPRPGERTAPDLIAASQLAVQIGSTPELEGRQLMVLFTTNFPPGPTLRQAARDVPGISTLMKSLRYEDVYDSWEVERVDFGRTLAVLSQKFQPDANGVRAGSVVVLSGDVHSSSASRIHYRADVQQTGDAPGAATKADLVIAQFVSSAINNGNADTRGQHTGGYEYIPPEIIKKVAAQTVLRKEDFIGWNPRAVPKDTVVARRSSTVHSPRVKSPVVYDEFFHPDRSILTLRVETFLGMQHVTKIAGVLEPPHFRIHLEYLKAASGSHDAYTPPAIDKTNPLLAARDRSIAAQRYVINVRDGQFIVGRNNIAEVGFGTDPKAAPKLQASLTVRWFNGTANERVRFDAPLAATNDFAKYPGEP